MTAQREYRLCLRGKIWLMFSLLKTIWTVFMTMFRKRVTIQYPEEKPYIPPRWRGRIILSRDPDGQERCVACYLCAVACPVDLHLAPGRGG